MKQKIDEGLAAINPEKNSIFIEMAKKSGSPVRMDYSVVYGGYSAKIKPDPDNDYKWIITFDD